MNIVYKVEIPIEWQNLYDKILFAFAQYGNEALKDCKATCESKNTHIVDCYNIFNSALAAKLIGNERQANLLYNYVKGQFDIYYPNLNFKEPITYYMFPSSKVDNFEDYKIVTSSYNNVFNFDVPVDSEFQADSIEFYIKKEDFDANPLYLYVDNVRKNLQGDGTVTINDVVYRQKFASMSTTGLHYVQLRNS